jgi:hypothetical protein
VNLEMRVGALEETITVTGETPIVDVQSTTKQRVMSREVIDSIPTSRIPYTGRGTGAWRVDEERVRVGRRAGRRRHAVATSRPTA